MSKTSKTLDAIVDDSWKEYHKKSYWDERYKNIKSGDIFEWYFPYSSFSELVESKLKPRTKVLIVGCGNSELGLDIAKSKDNLFVHNIDVSPTVISLMQSLHKNKVSKSTLKYEEMDASKMQFEDSSFDVIIDKGTVDALMCGNRKVVRNVIKEISRVLTVNGHFFLISHFSSVEQSQLFLEYITPLFDWENNLFDITVNVVDEDSKDEISPCIYIFRKQIRKRGRNSPKTFPLEYVNIKRRTL